MYYTFFFLFSPGRSKHSKMRLQHYSCRFGWIKTKKWKKKKTNLRTLFGKSNKRMKERLSNKQNKTKQNNERKKNWMIHQDQDLHLSIYLLKSKKSIKFRDVHCPYYILTIIWHTFANQSGRRYWCGKKSIFVVDNAWMTDVKSDGDGGDDGGSNNIKYIQRILMSET